MTTTEQREHLMTWIGALRSGEFTKIKEFLGDDDSKERCVVGVGMTIAKIPVATNVFGPNNRQDQVCEYFGVSDSLMLRLILMNNGAYRAPDASFLEIADWLEVQLEAAPDGDLTKWTSIMASTP